MNLQIESYTDRDRSAVLDLWARALPFDAITEDALEARVLLDENFDRGTFLLAKEGESLRGFVVGYVAHRLPMGDADPDGTRGWITVLAVDPQRDLKAVGTVLLVHLEQRFRSLGKTECHVSTYPSAYFTPGIDRRAYAPLLDLLLTREYTEVRQALSMDASIVLFEVPEAIRKRQEQLLRDGIEIRPYQRTDLVSFLDFLERSTPTDWMRVERANLKKIGSGGFRPDQVTIVTVEDEVIGYCQFEGSHFGPFGVSEAYQGKGIGTVLLARTLERMRTQGCHDAWVMWTDDKAAKVYQKFGFKETRRFSLLKKDLTTPTH